MIVQVNLLEYQLLKTSSYNDLVSNLFQTGFDQSLKRECERGSKEGNCNNELTVDAFHTSDEGITELCSIRARCWMTTYLHNATSIL